MQRVVNMVVAVKATAPVMPSAQAPVSQPAPAASQDPPPHEAMVRGPMPLCTFPPIPQPWSTRLTYPLGIVHSVKTACCKAEATQDSYATIAAMSLPPPPPPRPSLVISLSHSTDSRTLWLLNQMAIPEIVKGLNTMLLAHPYHTQVRLSTVKWSPKGNLVVIASPNTTLVQLEGASSAISSHLSSQLTTPAHIMSCINTKWSSYCVTILGLQNFHLPRSSHRHRTPLRIFLHHWHL